MILICGIPDAGKTTFSANYENVVHYDTIGGGRHRRQRIIDIVGQKHDVCVEGVYEKASDRTNLVLASVDDKNICIWLNTPVDVCIEREQVGRHRPGHIVQWAHEDFEPPTFNEGWDEIIIIRPDEREVMTA